LDIPSETTLLSFSKREKEKLNLTKLELKKIIKNFFKEKSPQKNTI